MKASEIIKQYRIKAQDVNLPQFLDDESALMLLNEAIREAVVRGRMLITSTDVDMCYVGIVSGVNEYDLHKCVYEIVQADLTLDDQPHLIKLRMATDDMVERMMGPDWQTRDGIPAFFVQRDMGFELFPKPLSNGSLNIRCYHLPKQDVTMDDEPNMHVAHHNHLVDWLLYKGFSIPDTEFFDPNRAANAEQDFSMYFGLGTDSGLRRETRSDVPQVVLPFLP